MAALHAHVSNAVTVRGVCATLTFLCRESGGVSAVIAAGGAGVVVAVLDAHRGDNMKVVLPLLKALGESGEGSVALVGAGVAERVVAILVADVVNVATARGMCRIISNLCLRGRGRAALLAAGVEKALEVALVMHEGDSEFLDECGGALVVLRGAGEE